MALLALFASLGMAPGPAGAPRGIELVSSGSGPTSCEREFFERTLNVLQNSATGRDVLRGTLAEFRTRGQPLRVSFEDLSNTQIADIDGNEELQGTRGYSKTGQGAITLNRGFLKLRDQDEAVRVSSATLGHELRHVQLSAELKRAAPAFADTFEEFELADEQSARLKGYLIYSELEPSARAFAEGDLKSFVDHPRRFWRNLAALDQYYSLLLVASELKDPAAAYQRRQSFLEKKRQALLEERSRKLWTLQALRHAQGPEGLAGPSIAALDRLRARLSYLPRAIETAGLSIGLIEERRTLLLSPQGRRLAHTLQAEASNRELLKIREEIRSDQELLLARAKG